MREPNVAIYMLRCVNLGIPKDILKDITCGDVYDMLTESGNDQNEDLYPYKATQDDINSFFG